MKTLHRQDGTPVIGVPHRCEIDDEPTVTITCGNVKVECTLTYWHHLVQCGGWSDRACTSDARDNDINDMQPAVRAIEAELWRLSDERRRG